MKIFAFIILSIIISECFAQRGDSEQDVTKKHVDTLWIGNFELKDTTYVVHLDTLKKGIAYLKTSILNSAADSLIIWGMTTTTGGLYPVTSKTSNVTLYPQQKLYFDFAYHNSIGAFSKQMLIFFKENVNVDLKKVLIINIVGYTKE